MKLPERRFRTAKKAPEGKMPVVCVRSFFNQTVSRMHRQRRVWSMAAVTIFTALALTIVLLHAQVSFAVYMNGQEIGSARNMNDVQAAVTGAEQTLKRVFGQNYTLDGSISVTANLSAGADDSENLKGAILDNISGLKNMYVITVDGAVVGASEDEQTLEDILGGILNGYTTANTLSVGFKETVAVSQEYVKDDVLRDAAKIQALLTPGSGSAYALTVESAEQSQNTEPIDYTTSYVNDATIYEGTQAVKTAGAAGEKLITESISYMNGKVQSSKILASEVTKQPVTEVVSVGTMPKPKTASTGTYIWPAQGLLTSGFGYRTGFGSGFHPGIDIAAHLGDNIVASDGGVVVEAGWNNGGYGNLVRIQHDNGDITYYGHCSEVLVQVGDRVAQGQLIAHMGMTGQASGVHCHFEVRVNNKPVNPMNYLSK